MGLVRSFIGTDGIWQYIPHINTGLFSIIKVHFLLFANLIVDWHINTINFTDSGLILLFFMLFIGLSAYLKTQKRDITKEDYLIEGSVVPEDSQDSEIQKEEDEEGRSVCDIVGAMDFTAKEPQLDITSEENQIYLEGYLKVLKNRIPTIGKVEVKYYKDLWKAGIEFEQLLKEKDTREYPYLYYYDDLDGDGKPEFAINQGCMFLLKYEKEQGECRILYQTESCYFETIVGAGQILYHDGLHVDIVRDNYIGLGEDGSFQDILWLEKGINPKSLFYKVGVGGDPTYFEDVSEEEWNEITQPFFEMVENNAVPRKTLKEVFGDLLEENTNYSE